MPIRTPILDLQGLMSTTTPTAAGHSGASKGCPGPIIVVDDDSGISLLLCG